MRLLCYLLLLCGPLAAQAAPTLTKSLLGSGGNSATGTLVLTSNVGGPITGFSQASPLGIWHGFYGPLLQPVIGVEGPQIAFADYLAKPSPNPARGPMVFEFGSSKAQDAHLRVYDLGGRLVRRLHFGRTQTGVSRVIWDLKGDDGLPVPSGIYFVRLTMPRREDSQRLLVLR